MPILFDGFDAINPSQSLSPQVPMLEFHKPDSITAAKTYDGYALKATNGSYFSQFINTSSLELYDDSLWYRSPVDIDIGARFKVKDEHAENILMQFSINRNYSNNVDSISLLTNHAESLGKDLLSGNSSNDYYKSVYFIIFVKNGGIYLRSNIAGTRDELTLLSKVPLGGKFYLEFKYCLEYYDYNDSNKKSGIFIDGAKVLHIKTLKYNSSQYTYNKEIRIDYAYAPANMTIELDDIYVRTVSNHYGNQPHFPVLASAKAARLSLVTETNNWGVIGASSAESALSDSSDSTYIQSDTTADAVFRIGDNVSEIFAMNFDVRGSSQTDGVVSLTILDNANKEVTGTYRAAMSDITSNKTLSEIEALDRRKTLTEIIKSGAKLRVRT